MADNLKKGILFLSTWLLSCGLGSWQDPEHAIYLSLTEVNISSTANSQVRVKVFSDDLQNALRNFSDAYQHNGLQQYFEENKELAARYFDRHFALKVNQQRLDLLLTGHSIENDAHFIDFRFICPDPLQRLEVRADFLMELFPTQTNVVKITKNDQPLYLKLVKNQERQAITWPR